jgi:hypothetical protein
MRFGTNNSARPISRFPLDKAYPSQKPDPSANCGRLNSDHGVKYLGGLRSLPRHGVDGTPYLSRLVREAPLGRGKMKINLDVRRQGSSITLPLDRQPCQAHSDRKDRVVPVENPLGPTSNPAAISETLPIAAIAACKSAVTHCGGHDRVSPRFEFPIDIMTPDRLLCDSILPSKTSGHASIAERRAASQA